MKTISRWIIFSLPCVLIVAWGGAALATPPTDVSVVSNPEAIAESDYGHDDADENTLADGSDTSYSFDRPSAEEASIKTCTRSDGTETTCYPTIIASYSMNHDMESFSSPAIESTAEEEGIWFDMNAAYHVDSSAFGNSWGGKEQVGDGDVVTYLPIVFSGKVSGTTSVTACDAFLDNTTTRCESNTVFVESNGFPTTHNMMVGIASWQQQVPLPQAYTGDNAWQIPLNPELSDNPISGKTGLFRGAIALAVNGVPIFNALNNRGDDAFLAGELDEWGGHSGRADDYHYHVAPLHLQEVVGTDHPIAYGLDGFPIYGLTEPDGSPVVNLDEYNGHMDNDGNYHYHATETYPYINGGMRGVVTYENGQVEPQPLTKGIRPAGEPLQGAKITSFSQTTSSAYTLKYTLNNETYTVNYTIKNGTYTFEFIDPAGKSTVKTYTSGNGGTPGTNTFRLEAWADNWFAAYLGEELIIEDSVPITTERSFNSETTTFKGSYPLQLNVILKDYIENDTGLEYIGSNRQQMGDGGFIMQVTDLSSNKVVAVSNAEWACTVIHEAPLNKSCAKEANPVAGVAPCEFTSLDEPEGWKSTDFVDSSWTATTVHSAAAVSPKDGYNEISWDDSAQFIWGPDLETNNTILCRVKVTE